MIQELVEEVVKYEALHNRRPEKLEITVEDYEFLIGEVHNTYAAFVFTQVINRYFMGIRLKII